MKLTSTLCRNLVFHKCALSHDCKRKQLCGDSRPSCKRLCRACPHCNRICPDFIPKFYHCDLLDKAPFVCNGCRKKSHCRLDKYYYKATSAFRQYRTVLVESRTGINISEADLKVLDENSPLLVDSFRPEPILRP